MALLLLTSKLSEVKMEFNPVSWFEIYVQDMDRATKFYETVLDVKLERLNSPDPNSEMMAFPMGMERAGASGALAKMDGVSSGGNSILVYFNCKDCAIEASRVENAGGRIQTHKTSIGEYGFFALAVDTEGNMFGLHSME
jgi:predicted enzyme related to lactoylglutathione lyase